MKQHKADTVTANYAPSAKVVDGTLILSLPDAVTPVVWRLELGQARASAMEVRTGEDGRHALTLRTPRGETHEIGFYDNRDRAVLALMTVGRAMEHAAPAANDAGHARVPAILPSAGPKNRRKTLTAIAAVVLVGVLLAGIMSIGPRRVSTDGLGSGEAAAISPATGSAASGTGVPVSADSFLQQNR